MNRDIDVGLCQVVCLQAKQLSNKAQVCNGESIGEGEEWDYCTQRKTTVRVRVGLLKEIEREELEYEIDKTGCCAKRAIPVGRGGVDRSSNPG